MIEDEMDEKERLIYLIKKQVKILMEEAVAKRYIYEDSSSVLSLCALIDSCLSHGLKRRAIGLFRTNTSTALLHKVAKKGGGPAAELVAKLNEIDAAPATTQTKNHYQAVGGQNSATSSSSSINVTVPTNRSYWSSYSTTHNNDTTSSSYTPPPSTFARRIFPFTRNVGEVIRDSPPPCGKVPKSAVPLPATDSTNSVIFTTPAFSTPLYKSVFGVNKNYSSSVSSSSSSSNNSYSYSCTPSSSRPCYYSSPPTPPTSSTSSSIMAHHPAASAISRFRWIRVALINRTLIPVLEQIVVEGQEFYDKKTAVMTDPLLAQLLCSLLVGPTCALEYTSQAKYPATQNCKPTPYLPVNGGGATDYIGFGNDLPAAQELIRRHRLKKLRHKQQQPYRHHPLIGNFINNSSAPPLPSSTATGRVRKYPNNPITAYSLESSAGQESYVDSLYQSGSDTSVLLYGKNNVIVHHCLNHHDATTNDCKDKSEPDYFTGYLSLHRKTLLHSGQTPLVDGHRGYNNNNHHHSFYYPYETSYNNNQYEFVLCLKWTPNQLVNNDIIDEGYDEDPLMLGGNIPASNNEEERCESALNFTSISENGLKDVDAEILHLEHQRQPLTSNITNLAMGGTPRLDPKTLIELALTINVQDILYLHCHRKDDNNDSLILVRHDGIPIPPLIFPKGNHLLTFLACLENGLAPTLKLDPPLSDHQLKGKIFPKYPLTNDLERSVPPPSTKTMVKMNSASRLPRPFFFGAKNTGGEDDPKNKMQNLRQMKTPRSLDSIVYPTNDEETTSTIITNEAGEKSSTTDFDYIFRIVPTQEYAFTASQQPKNPIKSKPPPPAQVTGASTVKESAINSTYSKLKKTSKFLENYFVYPSLDLQVLPTTATAVTTLSSNISLCDTSPPPPVSSSNRNNVIGQPTIPEEDNKFTDSYSVENLSAAPSTAMPLKWERYCSAPPFSEDGVEPEPGDEEFVKNDINTTTLHPCIPKLNKLNHDDYYHYRGSGGEGEIGDFAILHPVVPHSMEQATLKHNVTAMLTNINSLDNDNNDETQLPEITAEKRENHRNGKVNFPKSNGVLLLHNRTTKLENENHQSHNTKFPIPILEFGDNWLLKNDTIFMRDEEFESKCQKELHFKVESQQEQHNCTKELLPCNSIIITSEENVIDNHENSKGPPKYSANEMDYAMESLHQLCETVRKQMLLRAFCGWLECSRYIKHVRNKISHLILPWSTYLKYVSREDITRDGLTQNLYETNLDAKSQRIIDSDLLLGAIYANGIENDNLRFKVWPFLLGYYYFSSTADERAELYSLSKELYEKNYKEWSKLESFIRQRDKDIAADQLRKLALKAGTITTTSPAAPIEAANGDSSINEPSSATYSTFLQLNDNSEVKKTFSYDNEGFEIIDSPSVPVPPSSTTTIVLGGENKPQPPSFVIMKNKSDEPDSLDLVGVVNKTCSLSSAPAAATTTLTPICLSPNSDTVVSSIDKATSDTDDITAGNDCSSSLFRKLSQASSIFGKRSSLTIYKAQQQQKTQMPKATPSPKQSAILSFDNHESPPQCKKRSFSRPGLQQILHHYPTPTSLSNSSSSSSDDISPSNQDNSDKLLIDSPDLNYIVENEIPLQGRPPPGSEYISHQGPADESMNDDSFYLKKQTYADDYLAQFYPSEIIENFALNIHRIDKDVLRCDRNFWYFEDQENLDKLRNVICSYVWKNLEIGYFQGMCDLAAPLLVIFNDEVLTYECFSKLMDKMSANFPTMGSAMDDNFNHMASLIEILDPEIHQLMLRSGEYSHFYFCYRWFLLDFKRELTYDHIFWVWETIWAARSTVSENFGLFIALALIEYYRTIILENNMEFTDIIKFFNEMAEKHPVKEILELSKKLVKNLQQILS